MSFVANNSPWYGIGTKVGQAIKSEEAMEMAELNWKVIPKKISVEGKEVPGYIANVRDNDDAVLGIVSEQYKIIQNSEAFSFADNIINDEVKYDSAGSLANGRKIYLSAKLPSINLLGNQIDNYLIFSNNHDGKGSIRVAILPISTKYKNPLNLNLGTADRSWSTIHSGDMEKKMEQAKETINFSENYLGALTSEAVKLSETPVSEKQKGAFIERLFPINPEDGDRRIENVMENRTNLDKIINEIEDFRGTQWQLITAVSIFVANLEPRRQTATYSETKFNGIISGSYYLDKAYSILK